MTDFNSEKERSKLKIQQDCLDQAIDLIDSFPKHPVINIPIMGTSRVNEVHVDTGKDRDEKIQMVYRALLNYKLNPGF